MLGALKDKATSAALKAAAKRHVAEFGELEALHIDSRAKRIEAVIVLKGEREPTRLVVASYALVRDEEGYTLHIGSVQSSKPWLDALCERFVVRRPFRIPEEIGRMAEKII